MTRPNIHQADFEYDDPHFPGYNAGEGMLGQQNVGDAAGGKELAVRLFELPPGQSLCPYHYEYAEEWLLVIEGELDLRTPSGTDPISSGHLACFPAGEAGAHKVTATGEQPARFMMWSRRANPEVVVYADTDKIGVFTDNAKDHFRFFRKDADVDYYAGEPRSDEPPPAA